MTPDEALARIDRCDGALHAFVRTFRPALGHGDGPTFAAKDLFDIAGYPTGGGARTPLDPAPAANSVAVQRLLDAGWRCVGKTHTVELAFGGWGTNRAVGQPRNPWDAAAARVAGGSSSGSAVAVAAGMCDVALGSDTGGSVRIPAATCGVVGLKPSRGLVSLSGVHPLSPPLDTVGVLARSVAMAALALGVIAGDARPSPDVGASLRADVAGRRLAALSPDALGELHPEVARLYAEALDRLATTGVTVEMVEGPPVLNTSFLANGRMMAGEGWRIWGRRIAEREAEMDPWIVRRFRAGADLDDAALRQAHAQRAQDQAAFAGWMEDFDGLISPTCPIPAPPITEVDENVSPLSRLTRAANWLDLPAISVPCGLTDAGLPVGLQIAGRALDETGVISLGAAFEAESGWDSRRPDLSGF